jgi:hypothetical protein
MGTIPTHTTHRHGRHGTAVDTRTGAERRDDTLDMFAYTPGRAEVVAALREHARRVWQDTQQPVSANDLQELYDTMNYGGSASIVGAVLRAPHWRLVGYTKATHPRKRARVLGLWVPAEVPRSADAQWVGVLP